MTEFSVKYVMNPPPLAPLRKLVSLLETRINEPLVVRGRCSWSVRRRAAIDQLSDLLDERDGMGLSCRPSVALGISRQQDGALTTGDPVGLLRTVADGKICRRRESGAGVRGGHAFQ